jgi:hypothetical protein
MNRKHLKSKADDVRHVEPYWFGIILVPVAIFLMHKTIGDYMIVDNLKIPADILMEGRDWLEAAGRYRFIAATWFYGALTMLAVALLVRTLCRPMSNVTRIAATATWLFVLLLAAIPTFKNFSKPDTSHVFDRLGSEVFHAALARGEIPGCNGPNDPWLIGVCGETPVVTLFARIMDLVNVLAGLGVGALIVGMILCLASTETEDIDEQATMLAENLRQMRHQLYLSGLILTFGMLFATSWMYWPLQLVIEAERAAYGSLLLSAALYTGTYFSLLILSFYLPVALILEGRVCKLARRAGPSRGDIDMDDWRETHGLKEGASDYIRAGLALTAPILTAFAGGISPLTI